MSVSSAICSRVVAPPAMAVTTQRTRARFGAWGTSLVVISRVGRGMGGRVGRTYHRREPSTKGFASRVGEEDSRAMLKWLGESVVFGFGASARRDLYKGAKEAAEDEEAP